MKELLYDSAKFFHTDIILVIISLISSIYIYINRYNNAKLKLLYTYPLISFLNSIFNYYILYFCNEISTNISEFLILISNLIFTLFEFIILSFFLISLNKNNLLKKISILLQITYFVIFSNFSINSNSEILIEFAYILNFSFLIIISILNIFSLINIETEISITYISEFWVITGVFVYFLGTIPIFLSHNFVFHDNFYINQESVYSLNYITYIIFFIILSYSSKCLTPKTQ